MGSLCPRCGRAQPQTASQDKCRFCGAELTPEPTPAVLPPPPPPAEDELSADKQRCPHCGETLFVEEQRCWKCGHEFAAEASTSEPAPTTAPPPPPPPAVSPPLASPIDVAAREAQVFGLWALLTGLFGLFGCVGLLGPLAIYLGVRANRAGSTGLGTAGIFLGIMGCLVLAVVVALALAGALLNEPAATTIPSPGVMLPPLWFTGQGSLKCA